MTDRENRNPEIEWKATQETDLDMDQEMLSLQAELDRMASEVPEMPESFRKGWREAIRKEAASAHEGNSEVISSGEQNADQKSTAPSEGNPPGKKIPQRRTTSLQRWLQVAAVFLFLLGGTLLGQDTVRLTQVSESPAVTAEQADAVSLGAAASNAAMEEAYEAEETEYEMEEDASYDSVVESAYEAASYVTTTRAPFDLYAGVGNERQQKEEELRTLKQKGDAIRQAGDELRQAAGIAPKEEEKALPLLRIIGAMLVLASIIMELVIWRRKRK